MMRKKISLAIVILLLFVQYAYGIGFTSQVKAAAIDHETNIITSVSMAVYGPDGSTVTDSVYDVNSKVTLDYTWALPDGHSYSAGDTFTFQLPGQFQLFNDISGALVSDDGQVGDFTISQSTHQVVMTFNNYIEDHGNVHGTLRVNTKFDRTQLNGSTVEQILFPVEGGIQTVTVHFRPEVSSTIAKNGVSSGFNADHIDWTVDVNKKLESVQNAVVTDPIPAGLSLDSTVTLAVYQLNVQLDGTVLQGNLIDTSKYSAEVAGGTLIVRFTDSVLNGAYRIAYSTGITGDEASYTNTATFTGDGRDPVSASATVAVQRGGSLNKKALNYEWGKHITTWGIEYNYNKRVIPQQSAVLTDLFDDSQRLVTDSVRVYPVTLDSTGKATKGTALAENVDYTLTGIIGVEKAGFKLEFLNGISSAYLIEYKTEAQGRVYKDTTITNTVSDSTYSVSATQLIRPAIIYKTLSGVDYSKQTVNWKITLNGDNYPMKEVVLTDTFPQGGLKFIPDTLVVRTSSGAVLDSSAYTLVYNESSAPHAGWNKGFKVIFNSKITGTYTIGYTTHFSSASLIGNTDNFINTGTVDWKDIEGKRTASANGLFIPRPEYKNNGFKTGVYDAATKEITWTIGVNYTSMAVIEPVVSDILTAGQSLVPGSLKVYKMNLNANGDYTKGDELAPDSYSFRVNNGNEYRFVFTDSINKPYYVVFKTSLAGQLIDSKVVNTAQLFDGTKKVSKDLTASVNIPHGGEYVFKSGLQNGDKVNWSIAINRTQSHVKDAKITDTPSTNQILLPDSFHLYPTVVAANGDVTKSSAELTKGTDYTLKVIADADGKQSFELSFASAINSAYVLEYQSLIVANTGDKLVNEVKFSGNNNVLIEKDTTTEVIVGVSSGSGTGSGVKGMLTVKKLDAQNSQKVLEGATFELYRLNGTERVLVNTRTTDAIGTAVFNNIWLGSYILIETAAPSGYVLDTREYPVTISSVAGVNLTVYNTPVVPTATPTPTPTASTTPTESPSASASPIVSPAPTTSAEVTPAPTTSATASPTPSPALPGGTPFPTSSPIPGVIIDDDAIPGGPAITPAVSAGPSTLPAAPTAAPDETVVDDDIPLGEVDIDEDDIPKGTVTDSAGSGSLPQTGESSPMPIYLAGLGLIVVGFVLNRVFRRNRNQ